MGVDYYGVMGLTHSCSNVDIKQKYKALALQLHPQRKPYPPHTPKPFQMIPIITWEMLGEAYDVLSDPLRREIFDQYGEEGLKRGVPTPDGYHPPYVYHGDPMKIYNDYFGSASPYPDLLEALVNPPPMYDLPEGRGIKSKDKEIIQPLMLTLNEVYFGGIKKMKIQRMIFKDEQCVTTELREKILNVPIQRGILPGTKLTFPNEGDQGPTKQAADIVFIVADRPHETFTREGPHLLMNDKVSLKDALCGTSVTVRTLDQRTLRIPITDVIHPGYEKIVVGEGMPRLTSGDCAGPFKGDLVIRFEVEFPKYLPKTSKTLIARAFQLAQQAGGACGPDNVHRMVLADKMKRIAKEDRLPD